MEDGLNALYANQIDLRGSSSSSVLKFLSRFDGTDRSSDCLGTILPGLAGRPGSQ
jgi:hypothetical protein